MKKIAIVLSLTALLALTACSKPAASQFKDGSYKGKGQGFKGEVEVEVVVANGKIKDVKVVKHNDTPGISDAAIAQVPAAIVKEQKAEVTVATGATKTNGGIIEAVKAALEQAKK